MKSIYQIILFLVLAVPSFVYGQHNTLKDSLKVNDYIQFSGTVVTEDLNGEVVPLPYVNIGILGTSRGTYSEVDGFFSLVARKGDTIKFSRVGYKDAEIEVPDTLSSIYYSWIQIMSQDSILLPEAVIFPWPDRDFYRIEFLALDVSNELRSRARENLAAEVMEAVRESLPADGSEAYGLELEKRISDIKYTGQYKPQNIFNPVAWAKFVKAWKNGDFKKKKDKN